MKNLETLNKMLECSKKLKDSIKNYHETSRKSACDKYNAGFNIDGRFSSFKTVISIDSYLGYYGNSSCSTAISIRDRELFEKYFIKYLNRNFWKILEEVSDEIEKDTINFRKEAIKELEQAIEKINNLDKEE